MEEDTKASMGHDSKKPAAAEDNHFLSLEAGSSTTGGSNNPAGMDNAVSAGNDDDFYDLMEIDRPTCHFNVFSTEGRVTREILNLYAHVENGPTGLFDGERSPGVLVPCGGVDENARNLPTQWHSQKKRVEAMFLHKCEYLHEQNV